GGKIVVPGDIHADIAREARGYVAVEVPCSAPDVNQAFPRDPPALDGQPHHSQNGVVADAAASPGTNFHARCGHDRARRLPPAITLRDNSSSLRICDAGSEID